jgi:hypothetical protein
LQGEKLIEIAQWASIPVVMAFGFGGGEGGAMLRKARRPVYHHFVLVNSVVDVIEGENDEDGGEDGGREGRPSGGAGKDLRLDGNEGVGG